MPRQVAPLGAGHTLCPTSCEETRYVDQEVRALLGTCMMTPASWSVYACTRRGCRGPQAAEQLSRSPSATHANPPQTPHTVVGLMPRQRVRCLYPNPNRVHTSYATAATNGSATETYAYGTCSSLYPSTVTKK